MTSAVESMLQTLARGRLAGSTGAFLGWLPVYSAVGLPDANQVSGPFAGLIVWAP
jgi:hypothetical protein